MIKKYLFILMLSIIGFFLWLYWYDYFYSKRVTEEPIRIYIENDLPKNSILIWNKKIEWVDLKDNPDLVVKKTNILPHGWWAYHSYVVRYFNNKFVDYKRPVYLYIKFIDSRIIAHEFGHFIGLEHTFNTNSIMCSNYRITNTPLSNFIEFKK